MQHIHLGRDIASFAYGCMRTLGKRKGFTLVEILLVVLIIALTASIAVPTFINSVKGAQLRSATRAVIGINRYARSMAIMQQKQAVVRYHLEEGNIEMGLLDRHSFSGAMRSQIDSSGLFGEGDAASDEEVNAAQVQRSTQLKSGITIQDFEGGVGQEFEGGIWINYYPNGMCDEHSFRLVDENGDEATINVGGITGEINMEMVVQ